MSRLAPILASEKKAAELLDMPVSQFRELVEAGHLPPPLEIAPGCMRWDTEGLRQIGRGDAIGGRIDW